MSDALSYAISLQTADAQAAMERFSATSGVLVNRLNETGSAAARASGKGNTLVGTLTRMGAAVGFAALIKRGAEFNATMQDGEGAIAAIIEQFQGLNAEAAKAEAAKAMQQLIDLEPKAAGTLTDLLNGFSSTAAAAAGVGISISQNIDLTGRFANALGRLRLPVEQIGQEMRSILTGNIGADSQLAKTLGITNEMVKAAKDAGNLYDLLVAKIGKLGDAADNVATRVSSFQSAIDKALGAITAGGFDVAVGQMGDLTTAINENAENFKALGAAIAVAAKGLVKFGEFGVATFRELGYYIAGLHAMLEGESWADYWAGLAATIQAEKDAAAASSKLEEQTQKTNQAFDEASLTATKATKALDDLARAKKSAQFQAAATANMGEIALLKAQAAGQDAKARAIQRELDIRKETLRIMQATGASEEQARQQAEQKAKLQDRIDGKRSKIGGVTASRMMGGPTFALSNNGPLAGGGLDELTRLQQRRFGAKGEKLPAGYNYDVNDGRFPVNFNSLSTRKARPVGGNVINAAAAVNAAVGAPAAAARQAANASTGGAQGADPVLSELQGIRSELSRIRTA